MSAYHSRSERGATRDGRHHMLHSAIVEIDSHARTTTICALVAETGEDDDEDVSRQRLRRDVRVEAHATGRETPWVTTPCAPVVAGWNEKPVPCSCSTCYATPM